MRGRKPLYPWEEWFKKKRFRVVRGKDYSCSEVSMSQQIRNAACRIGVTVDLIEEKEGFLVRVNMRDRKPIYPWDDWFGRKCFRVVRNKDYICSQCLMVQQIRNAARRLGVTVDIVEEESGFLVKVETATDET